MKTNIADLMNKISELEMECFELTNSVKGNALSTTTEELDGRVNVIKDNKKTFDNDIKEFDRVIAEISRLKSILYEKNNTFKLADGRTIQAAIVENKYLRKQKEVYNSLLNYSNSKKRITEVNNSYFEVSKTNFDTDDIKRKISMLTDSIQKTDFEISKLNSQEFEI